MKLVRDELTSPSQIASRSSSAAPAFKKAMVSIGSSSSSKAAPCTAALRHSHQGHGDQLRLSWSLDIESQHATSEASHGTVAITFGASCYAENVTSPQDALQERGYGAMLSSISAVLSMFRSPFFPCLRRSETSLQVLQNTYKLSAGRGSRPPRWTSA